MGSYLEEELEVYLEQLQVLQKHHLETFLMDFYKILEVTKYEQDLLQCDIEEITLPLVIQYGSYFICYSKG
ncbi:hypothetical protein A4A71_01755 [Nicoletella semolina]|nr:hypothetical protein [Nicoletella semolina]